MVVVAVAAVAVAAVAAVAAVVVAAVVVAGRALLAMRVRRLAGVAMGHHAPSLDRIALFCRSGQKPRRGHFGVREPSEKHREFALFRSSGAAGPGGRLAPFERLRTLGHV
jgi:hypothetical protein